MEKLIIVIEKSSDYMGAYSENCDGIYGAGATIEDVKQDVLNAISTIKSEYPKDSWPALLRGDYEIEWKFDAQSFLEYYKGVISLAGLEKITGVNQKQLSNYLNHRATPRRKQTERINAGLHRFAHELLSITL